LECCADQRLQRLVLKDLPPRHVAQRLGAGRSIGRASPEVAWDRELGPTVVRPHGAAGQEEDRRGNRGARSHACCPPGTWAGVADGATDCLAGAPFLPSPSTNVKLPGMRNTPSAVATSMPQNTAVPMTFCAPAPAPLASISGTTPRMKANAVIK